MDSLTEDILKACAMEDIVAEDKADAVVADELAADDEGLRQSVRRWLLGILEPYTQVAAVAEQTPERR